jgi:hypothetical protein
MRSNQKPTKEATPGNKGKAKPPKRPYVLDGVNGRPKEAGGIVKWLNKLGGGHTETYSVSDETDTFGRFVRQHVQVSCTCRNFKKHGWCTHISTEYIEDAA